MFCYLVLKVLLKAYPKSLFNALNDVLAKEFVRMAWRASSQAGALKGVLMVVISVIGGIKEPWGPPLSRATKSLV